MANIANRSPWLVKVPGQEPQKFRLKSKAQSYIDDNKLSRAKLQQLETAFEVQIKLKDDDGNVVTRSATLDTKAEAIAWAAEEEEKILKFKKQNGSFDTSFEHLTLDAALRKFHEEHYKGKNSFAENGYRVEHLSEWLDGKTTLLRDLTSKRMLKFRKFLQDVPYSASSIRNYFTVINGLYKHALSEWQYIVENPCLGIKLPKPNNAIERYWKDDEKERFYISTRKHRPWMEDVVDMSLEMSFRLGELVAGAKSKKTGEQTLGMLWEGIDFQNSTVRIFKEKNDWQKPTTEFKGRVVPMTPRMREILEKLYAVSKTKKGPVFLTMRKNGMHTPCTRNTLGHAFKVVCDKAEPPIIGLTFHSCRKIATVDLARKVPNAMMLSKLTGHKSVAVLAARYFAVPMDDLKILLNIDTSRDIIERAISILEKSMNPKDVAQFLKEVKKIAEIGEVVEGGIEELLEVRAESTDIEEGEVLNG